MRQEVYLKYLLILPLIALVGGLIAYPLARLITYSLSAGILGQTVVFPTFENIWRMLSDASFFNSIGVTLWFVFVSVAIEFIIGLALALFISGIQSTVIRSILLCPLLIAPVAVGLIWRLMYHPMFGIINNVLYMLGLPAQGWLADRKMALPSVIITDIWQFSCFIYLILLAGLQSLPQEPYEAAKIDGASKWQEFRFITLPLLKPAIYVAILFRTMGAFKAFGKFVTLTSGGPGQATEILTLHIYKVAFKFFNLGYGAFLALVAVAIIVLYNESYIRVFGLRR